MRRPLPALCVPLVGSLLVISPGCKKKAGTRTPDAAPPAIGEFPLGEAITYEDEEARFRVELPGTPVESEETDEDPEALVVRHTAQFRDGDSELMLMWNELPGEPEDEAEALAVLADVITGWGEAGLQVSDQKPTQLDVCVARTLRGSLENQPVEGKVAICGSTLIQIVASGTYVSDAARVFNSFEWLR